MKNKSKERKEVRFIIQQILFGAHFFTNRQNLPSLGSQKKRLGTKKALFTRHLAYYIWLGRQKKIIHKMQSVALKQAFIY